MMGTPRRGARRWFAWGLLLAGTVPLPAQELSQPELDRRIEWLRAHTMPIRSINIADAEFDDLEPLRDALLGVDLVLMGEQTHGDGATFMAKNRLVRFLYERMGFDVLAWESGLFDMRRVDSALRGDGPILDVVELGLARTWGHSEQVQPLLEFARATRRAGRPLHFAGFDIQFSSTAAHSGGFWEGLRTFLDDINPPLLSAQQRRLLEEMFGPEQDLANSYVPDRDIPAEAFDRYRAVLDELVAEIDANRDRIHQKHGEREVAYWRQVLRSTRSALTNLEGIVRREFRAPEFAVRDTAMASNLVWLLTEGYRGHRIVGWAHSGHIMRATATIDDQDTTVVYTIPIPMGDEAHARLGDRVYAIGFLAWGGEYGRITTARVPEPPRGSLDWLLHQVGEPYLFLDLRSVPEDHWLRTELVARPFYVPFRADWTRVFDGIVFTDVMSPNVPLQRER